MKIREEKTVLHVCENLVFNPKDSCEQVLCCCLHLMIPEENHRNGLTRITQP